MRESQLLTLGVGTVVLAAGFASASIVVPAGSFGAVSGAWPEPDGDDSHDVHQYDLHLDDWWARC